MALKFRRQHKINIVKFWPGQGEEKKKKKSEQVCDFRPRWFENAPNKFHRKSEAPAATATQQKQKVDR